MENFWAQSRRGNLHFGKKNKMNSIQQGISLIELWLTIIVSCFIAGTLCVCGHKLNAAIYPCAGIQIIELVGLV